MKTLNTYIIENLKGKSSYKYFPKTKKELENILEQLIKERGKPLRPPPSSIGF